MKVVCESCQAKYQVPDERVAGKKLKIRCKRCGATVLIRGDLTNSGLSDSPQPAASAAASIAPDGLPPGLEGLDVEWHASVDGESYGPFDTNSLLRWLGEQAAGWDAHVWREGFTDWQLARDVAELTALAGAAMDAPLPYPSPISTPDPFGSEAVSPLDEAGPAYTFGAGDLPAHSRAASSMAAQSNGNGARSQDPRTRGSSIRTHSSPSLAAASNPWSSSPAAASSPRVTAAQALTGERNEDSVLFSTANLQQVAMTTSQPGYAASAGYASGEASGLIDIRALASLARQTTPQISPSASYDRFRADDDSRMAVMNQTGAFNRVDSLAPVSTSSRSSTAAVPLAILGGFALVAAAAFAAILITRETEPPAQAMAVVPDAPSSAHTAQPTITQEPSTPTPPHAAPEPVAAAAEEPAEAAEAEGASEDDLLAGAKTKRQRGARTAAEDKKETLPVEKAKPKKEEKSAPPSSDEVMLADKPEKAAEPEPKPEAKPEPKPASTSGSDIDALLAGKPTKAGSSSKSRSIDDLLSGASDKKPAAPAPAPAPATAAAAAVTADMGDEGDDLPASPSRDETLAAMRGVESAVRACGGDQPLKGTAEVQITVTGTTGRVTNATVSGITGEPGSCIARAARNAKFPRFSKPTFSIKYPYRFQ